MAGGGFSGLTSQTRRKVTVSGKVKSDTATLKIKK
jgi:hypothetical protein